MQGEKEFIALLNKHQHILYKVCSMYMDERAEREDLFQEIALQAWKSFSSFKGQSQFSTWLYRVALNTAISFFKKGKKANTTYFPDIIINTPTEELNPIEEQVKAMYKAIGELSKIDKALVMLYLEDYSYNDIADMLGITANNVAVKMNRLKIKLKEQSQKYYQS
ncbi:RNA polymerase sigma factor [Parasediminibacterium sp. JCM 36343]|uniref:RNA polymerase sigma factor n=1 Tax=Parasediminibacterium sp. JCM 36343 TaxID=3374279 RepID=UPI00397CA5E3